MNKRKILVLSIGFTLIAVTCITIVIFLIQDFRNASPLDKRLMVPIYFFLVFPIILEELSLLRSVYKLIIFNPRTSAKICYIISVVIVFAALIFQLLAFTNVITKDILPDGPQAASSRFVVMLILTGWSAVLVSFALGSVKSGKEE